MNKHGRISRRHDKVATLLAIALAGLAGCGSGVETYPVAGQVVWADGGPATELAGGTVGIQNVDPAARIANTMGVIQPDARFTLRTGADGEGAPAGQYRAMVMPELSNDPTNPLPQLIDERLLDFRTSGLEVTIEPQENQITIEVERYE